GIGAAQQVQPVGVGAERGPYFLAGDDPLVAVPLGARLQPRQITSGVRFAEALAPEFFAASYRRQEPLFLGVRAEFHESRAEKVPASSPAQIGPLCVRVTNLESRLMNKGPPPPSIFFGPVHVQPPPRRQLSFPFQTQIPQRVIGWAPDAPRRLE